MELLPLRCCLFFFFQAEDGIRDLTVTGVQTCALPIYKTRRLAAYDWFGRWLKGARDTDPEPKIEMAPPEEDRKSTRLNSSHSQISYAVFCLKKKRQRYPAADPSQAA